MGCFNGPKKEPVAKGCEYILILNNSQPFMGDPLAQKCPKDQPCRPLSSFVCTDSVHTEMHMSEKEALLGNKVCSHPCCCCCRPKIL